MGSGGGEGRESLGTVFYLQDNILRDASGTQYVTLVQDGQVSHLTVPVGTSYGVLVVVRRREKAEYRNG